MFLTRVFIILALFRVGPGRCWRQTSVNINWVSKQGWITFGAAEIISLYYWTPPVLLNGDVLMTAFSGDGTLQTPAGIDLPHILFIWS